MKSIDTGILVSVICNAYNQEKYIRDALEGFVSQRTSFTFEVLIHDDASTDGTPNVIKEYEKKYPQIIKPIYQIENQYRKKVKITNTYQLPRAKGKYIAFCEGDDYWTDPEKLQRQVDALELHPEIDMAAHAVEIEVNGRKKGKVSPSNRECILPIEKVILNGGSYLGTCSLMLRNSIHDCTPPFRKEVSMDYTIQVHGALHGGVYYFPSTMGVYRIGSDGSWTERILRNPDNAVAHYKKMISILDSIKRDTKGKYDTIIQFVQNEYLFKIYYTMNDKRNVSRISKQLTWWNNKGVYKYYTIKEALKQEVKYVFPWLYQYLHK